MATALSALIPEPLRRRTLNQNCILYSPPAHSHSLDDDAGSHHMCITMWPNGVGHSGDVNFCEQTGQGVPPNDWCESKMPCHEDAGQDCDIKNWCVCQWAWEMYVEKQGCANIVDLHCESVNMKALEACASHRQNRHSLSPARQLSAPSPTVADEADPTTHATALACLKEKCNLDKTNSVAAAAGRGQHVLAGH